MLFISLALCLIYFSKSLNAAAAPACPTDVFNPPTNLSLTTWYPDGFTGQSAPPPLFSNNFNCIYNINVPKGYSALLSLTVQMTLPDDMAVSVTVIDQNKNAQPVYNTQNEAFFFVADGGKIQLNTREQNIHFGFGVKWFQMPTAFSQVQESVNISDAQPVTLWGYSGGDIYQIQAETKVSMIVVPPLEDTIIPYLRSLIIYDGPDWNSPCLGSALQVLQSKRQLVSSGKFLTVEQLRPYFTLGRTFLIFQDYQKTKDIVQYQGVSCVKDSDCGSVNMDGTTGPAAFSTVQKSFDVGAEYLTALSGSGVLDVYMGAKTDSKSNLIYSYNLSSPSLSSYLPQEFLGYTKTYVLTGTNANLRFSRMSVNFLNSAQIGRKGFLASRYFKSGSPTPYQSVYDSMSSRSNQLFNVNFNIRFADFVGNTTLNVKVLRNGKDAYNKIFTSSNLPTLNNPIQVLGDDLTVDYKTYGQSTSGYYLDFEFQKSSATIGFLISVVLVFLLSW